MKLSKPKYFIILEKSNDPFPIWIAADWETDKSFGIRGTTFDAVRYTKSTGEMYSKSNYSWKSFEDKADANEFMDKISKAYEKLEQLKKHLRVEIELLHSLFN